MSYEIGGGTADLRGIPIIWPKSQKQSSQQTQSEQAKQAQQSASAQSASQVTQTPQEAQQTQQAQQAAPPPPATRPLAMADVLDQLFQLGIPNTPENKEMASMMMSYGMELSEDNFSQLFKLIKGDKKPSTMESAVIALSKGLASSPQSVSVLSNFLSNNAQVAQQMEALRNSLALLQQKFTTQLMDPGLLANLSSILIQTDDELKKMIKKETSEGITPLKRGALLKNCKALLQFLSGLEQQLAQSGKLETPEGKELQRQLSATRERLKSVLDNLTSQNILCKESDRNMSSVQDKFAYWQIPNPFMETPSNVELAIRKDLNKDGNIDPTKTRLYLKLETPELGEITIVLDVLDKKVWYIFNTESDEINGFITKMHQDLLKRMEALNYNMAGFQAVKKKMDLKKYVLPTLNLDNMVRIRTEV